MRDSPNSAWIEGTRTCGIRQIWPDLRARIQAGLAAKGLNPHKMDIPKENGIHTLQFVNCI